jgi:hypothetical protein
MMLADPRGMKADLLGIDRLVENIGDELVSAPFIVVIMVVAQREIAELHLLLPGRPKKRPPSDARKASLNRSRIAPPTAIKDCMPDRPPLNLQHIYSDDSS